MRFNVAIPLSIFTILTSSILLAADVKPTVTDPSPSQLTLQLEPSKKTFALYEPVFVTCTLTNPEPWSIIAEVKGLALADKYVTLTVQEGDQPPTKYYSGVVADALGPATRDLSPGQFMVDTLSVFFNDLAGNLAFPRPGIYRIYGKIYLGNYPDPIFVNSAPVQIDVIQPQKNDLRVIESLGSSERLVSLLRKGSRAFCEGETADCLEALHGLVASPLDSGYVPSIALDLAVAAGHVGAGAAPNYDLQADLLQKFLKRWPDHPLAPSAMRLLAYSVNKGGKYKQAMEWVELFEKKYPSRESPRKVIERANRSR